MVRLSRSTPLLLKNGIHVDQYAFVAEVRLGQPRCTTIRLEPRVTKLDATRTATGNQFFCAQ